MKRTTASNLFEPLWVYHHHHLWMLLLLLLLVLVLQAGGSLAFAVSNNNNNINSHMKMKMVPPSSPPPPPERVLIIGGTHGNEYTGVWCIKSIQAQGGLTKFAAAYPSLHIDTLLANPKAHLANKRFLDTDLNREFSVDKLLFPTPNQSQTQTSPTTTTTNMDHNHHNHDNDNNEPYETKLARELDQFIADGQYQVAVDLHSTTSNMGTTLIFPEGDPLMAQAAAYICAKCNNNHNNDDDMVRCLVEGDLTPEERSNLSSAVKHDFTIEVGPVPTGVLRHDVIEKTQRALHYFLEFLHWKRQEYNKNIDGDDDQVTRFLRRAFPTGRVPCFRTAPPVAQKQGGNDEDDDDESQPPQLIGKIPWPSDPDNPNFPLWMVHKNLQDADYRPIRVGDPLFVTHGGDEICYDGSHGDVVHLIFINEAGYYYSSSGTGIGVAVPAQFQLHDGMLLVVDEDTNDDETTTTWKQRPNGVSSASASASWQQRE